MKEKINNGKELVSQVVVEVKDIRNHLRYCVIKDHADAVCT